MQTIYVRFYLSGESEGTQLSVFAHYEMPDLWTTEYIDAVLWDKYLEMQLEHFEQYSGYHEYCEDHGYFEEEEGYELAEQDAYWDEYLSYVMEQGGFHVQNYPFTEEELAEGIVLDIEKREED